MQNSQAFKGRGTPPTNTVLRGSNDIEASNTKSASDKRHGRIWTGLFLMVGDETQMYSLSSSMMQFSIKFWTLLSSCEWEKTLKLKTCWCWLRPDTKCKFQFSLDENMLQDHFREIFIQFSARTTSPIKGKIEISISQWQHCSVVSSSTPNFYFFPSAL